MQPLQNVLSISTAGKNRYLLHFNSLHSLTQWTAGIRLALFEHATLQEAYTGSLIAGKGKGLNNIKVIMERTKFKTEDWARVRFGAGTPWRRCWCVISPPDEKELQKLQKSQKKKSAYDQSRPFLKGNVKFYDTKKTKKALPIATINDAYSAYAIYPQSKPLIDQSTLVKVEGIITIHSIPETTTEGFLFVMPEVHPAVSGFEMMLRWLFPMYDVFGLYGRPNRLIADTLDTRSLMFALPQERRYGYLEILDVAGLIHEPGSQTWKEKDWRKKLKELTSSRISAMRTEGGRSRSRASSYRGHRNSLPSRTGTLRYEDGASIKSTPSLHNGYPTQAAPQPSGSAPPTDIPFRPPPASRTNSHQRSVSEALPYSTPRHTKSQKSVHGNQQNHTPLQLSYESPSQNEAYGASPPPPPAHGVPLAAGIRNPHVSRYAELDSARDRSSSESDRRLRNGSDMDSYAVHEDVRPSSPPAPVVAPPAFAHEPGVKPQKRPQASPQMIRANSRLSITTLSQLADSGRLGSSDSVAAPGASAAWRNRSNTTHVNGTAYESQSRSPAIESPYKNGEHVEDHGQRGVNDGSSRNLASADNYPASEGMVLANNVQQTTHKQLPKIPDRDVADNSTTRSGIDGQSTQNRIGLRAPTRNFSRSVSPLSNSSAPISTPPEPAYQSNLSRNQAESPKHDTNVSNPYEQAFSSTRSPPPVPNDPERPEISRTNTNRSITRKPVPSRDRLLSQASKAPTVATKTSLESLQRRFVDEEVLNQIIAQQDSRANTMDSQAGQSSDIGSVYDDDSTASPDYASTRRSTETKRSRPSVDKPRAGKLKTVGTVEPIQREVFVGDTYYRPDAPAVPINPDIPLVDFGPTQALTPGSNSRPNTSGTMTQTMHERPKSSERPTSSSRNSPVADVAQNGGSLNFAGKPNEPYDRAPSRTLTTPEFERRTPSAGSDQDRRRSVAWQPGATIGGGSPGSRQSITPEQFVQQRAAANRATPVYAHGQRQSSSTPPPTMRNTSAEVPMQQHVRKPSHARDLQQSPRGQGSSNTANLIGDYSANLSAREQEHVARVTGSPLISMAGKSGKQTPQGGGLVGAIEAREQEKKDIKQGMSNQAVQHAIAQRQQHSQGSQSRQQSYNAPTPVMSIPGQWPQTPSLFAQTPGQYQPTPGYGQPQYGYGVPQQQNPIYIQTPYSPQQRQHQGQPPATQQYIYNQQAASPYQQQQQQFQQTPQQYPQTAFQQQQNLRQHQGPYQQGQGQQAYYGPYFGFGNGNGQGR